MPGNGFFYAICIIVSAEMSDVYERT